MILTATINEVKRRILFDNPQAVVAVKGDYEVNGIAFAFPAIYEDDFDLSTAVKTVYYKATDGIIYNHVVTDTDTDTGYPLWVFKDEINKGEYGEVNFALVCDKVENGTIVKRWVSLITVFRVQRSIEIDESEQEENEQTYSERLADLMTQMANMQATVSGLASGAPTPESLVANMQEGRIYVYTGTETGYTAGHLYYYVNGTLTDGGVYGGTFAAIKESKMVSITWAELKALRDDGQLIPGQAYRITDYICTTTQEGSRVESHHYDIIVTADSETALSEIARACVHDAASAEYYQYAHIEAWELKYSLDNNARRFAWADGENGRGVVYYLKDDHGNECPYDFKQIQFARYPITACTVSSLVGKYAALQHGKAITGIDKQNPVWCYTFSYDPESTGIMSDASVMEFNKNNNDNNADVSWNIIKPIYSYQNPGEEAGLQIALLNCIVLFGNYCRSNTFGNYCSFNTFGNNCFSNTFGDNCSFNTFGNNCFSNTFGDNCLSNTFGDGCSFNTFGNYCSANTFGNYCSSNTFGDYCSSNTFGNNYSFNTFGNYCSANTFGNYCSSNTFGDNCLSNTFGDNCLSNTFGNYCSYIDVLAGTSSQKQKRYYNVLDGVQGTNRSHISITGTGGNNFVTYVGKNSSGELKTWVPADLVQ